MYKSKKIAIVIPAYNVAKQIEKVITTLPKFIDKIVVIDDKSRDSTVEKIKSLKIKNKKIVFIQHTINQGAGGAVASGYKWSRDNGMDIAVVVDGDGQMPAKDIPILLDPLIENRADYSKANRLLVGDPYHTMPKIRYFGNATLSFLTKIASGYWHVMDSQSGFRAINKKMLRLIDWDKLYKRYGYPNDILVRLNVYNARVIDIPLEPTYNVGEESGMNIGKVFFTIPKMLIKMFLWRLKEKYIIRDFHPLVFFYFFGFVSGLISIALFIRLISFWPIIPQFNFLTWMLCVITSIQFIIFAMWFDMEYNRDLNVQGKD